MHQTELLVVPQKSSWTEKHVFLQKLEFKMSVNNKGLVLNFGI